MSRAAKKRRRVLAVFLVSFTLAVILYSATLSDAAIAADDFGFVIGVMTTMVIGMFLVLRRPENPMGLILEGFGAAFAVGASAEVIAVSTSPLAQWSAWLSTWQWALGLVLLLVLLPLLFPEGRLPSRGYRWVIPTAFVGLAFLILGNAFRTTTTIDAASGDIVVDLPVPLPLSTETFDLLHMGGMVCVLASVLGALAGVVRRFRRSTGLERQQMKVFGAGLLAALVLVAINLVLYSFDLDSVANVLFSLAIVGIMGSIAVAVLRYRLYDLEKVISRTITYSIVAVLVAVLYAVGAVWLPTLIVGGQSPLFVAASTLVAAAMFTPTRRMVMKRVDRRFNRSGYDAERIIDEFSAALQVRHQVEEIMTGLVDVVSSTFQPTATGMWIRTPRPTTPGHAVLANTTETTPRPRTRRQSFN